MLPLPNATCPLCGAPNECAPALTGSFDTPCWCTEVRIDRAALARLPEHERNRACLCRRCAAASEAHDRAP